MSQSPPRFTRVFCVRENFFGQHGLWSMTVKLTCLLCIVTCTTAFAQAPPDSLTIVKLKKLSMEELLNIEVTSISMRPEKLTEVASAVQVISGEDIYRSGVTRLPEALRLASNLQVAQATSHDWAITSRGFNGLPSAGGILANKLLVMIDGRSVYNPLFGGVYWDVQNVLLEDVDRIEVVSGPGGTLWGANAVNGVINVVTKSASETQGLFVSGGGGSFLKDFVQVRHGFRVDSTIFFRVYGQRFDQKITKLIDDKSAHDAWDMTQAGFRMDYYPSAASTFTLQGDVYRGDENDSVRHAITDGQNILARFIHQFSHESNLTVQAYFDRTWRTTPNSVQPFFYELSTYDLDIQHRFSLSSRHSVLYGIGYRLQKDKTTSSFHPPRTAPSLNPVDRTMPLYSAFIQDEITIIPEVVRLTIGSKFLHNVFSRFEAQPSARLAWTPNERQTVWGAISRAVRVPTRFDSDVTVTAQKFDSEKVISYEAGYRLRPADQLLFSLATFFSRYDDLRSLDTASNPPPPIILANSQRAESWGFELSGSYQATSWWRLRGGYTYFEKKIWAVSDKVLPVSAAFEGVDPKNVASIQSIMDLSANFQLDLTGRYVDVLPAVTATIPTVPSYYTIDARLNWKIKFLEISIVGQNIIDDQHHETGSSRIPRSIYGKITCRL
jgi:iron complex outermembrane recepter protein